MTDEELNRAYDIIRNPEKFPLDAPLEERRRIMNVIDTVAYNQSYQNGFFAKLAVDAGVVDDINEWEAPGEFPLPYCDGMDGRPNRADVFRYYEYMADKDGGEIAYAYWFSKFRGDPTVDKLSDIADELGMENVREYTVRQCAILTKSLRFIHRAYVIAAIEHADEMNFADLSFLANFAREDTTIDIDGAKELWDAVNEFLQQIANENREKNHEEPYTKEQFEEEQIKRGWKSRLPEHEYKCENVLYR